MRLARKRLVALFLPACLAFGLFGCAQGGNSMFARRTSIGSLKTGLSHLEYENRDLKSKVAELNAVNRDVEDRLVQEESVNGELRAKLDNARNLIGDRGGIDKGSDKVTDASIDSEPAEPPKTLKAGRPSKPKRKPPFAKINGVVEPLPSSEHETPIELPPDPAAGNRQSRAGDPSKWLPISQGAMESTIRVR